MGGSMGDATGTTNWLSQLLKDNSDAVLRFIPWWSLKLSYIAINKYDTFCSGTAVVLIKSSATTPLKSFFPLLLRTESTTSCDQNRNESHLKTACCLFTKPSVTRLCTRSLKEGSIPSLHGSALHSSCAISTVCSAWSLFFSRHKCDSQTSALKLKLAKGSQTETLHTDPPGVFFFALAA